VTNDTQSTLRSQFGLDLFVNSSAASSRLSVST